ncbi:MAG: thioredoxin domain-containing protein [bacterium]
MPKKQKSAKPTAKKPVAQVEKPKTASKKTVSEKMTTETNKTVRVININKKMLLTGGLFLIMAVALLISVLTSGFRVLPLGIGQKNDAALKKAVSDYIDTTLLQGQSKIEITKLEKNKDRLKTITFTVQGQEYSALVSTDAKTLYLLNQKFDLSGKAADAKSADYPKTDKPTSLFFTMAFCPYGNQAEGMINNVRALLKDKINLEPHYVIYSDYAKNAGATAKWEDYCSDSSQKYCSMHGIQELRQDVREICVYKNQPEKYWDFVDAINLKCTAQDADACWTAVAQDKGVDVNAVNSCVSTQSDTILASEAALNAEKSVQGSPTIFINDTAYEGSRAPESFKTAICSAFNNKPGECDTKLSTAAPDTNGQCN